MDQKRNLGSGGGGLSLRNKLEVPELSRECRMALLLPAGPDWVQQESGGDPERGAAAGPRYRAPFVSLNLGADAKAPALGRPVEAQALPSRSRLPALPPGAITSPHYQAAPFPFHVRVGPCWQAPGTTLAPRDPDGWRREGKAPAGRPATPPSRSWPSPTRLCPAGPRRKPGALTRRGAQGGQGRQENPERIRRAGAPQACWCPLPPTAPLILQ